MAHHAYTFQYRVRNWHHYKQALIARGGITFWIDQAALTTWRNTETRLGAGAPQIYSDMAIHCAVVVKSVYRLGMRAAQGVVSSLISLMRLDLPVPNSSTICRRQGTRRVPLSLSSGSRLRQIVINATGLRVYGAGDWHVQKHGSGRRRTWGKLHLGVDEQTKESVAVEILASHVPESRMLPSLSTQISGKVCQVSGDGADDTKACDESIGQRGAKATIPLPRNAKPTRSYNSPEKLAIRDANLCQIHQPGRYACRVASGCTRQSLAAKAVFRFKGIFGSRLRARRFNTQRVEGWITCMVLNRRVR